MAEIKATEEYSAWIAGLRDKRALVKISVRVSRVANGLLGDVKPVGEGVSELRIDYGPGYRVYFIQRGDVLIVLLAGGTKKTQAKDIRLALQLSRQYKEVE
jgi:putative addiction module killer protein